MTKAPRAGQVKTRLVPPLTPEEAAQLNICFLRDTAAAITKACAPNARGASPSRRRASIVAIAVNGFLALDFRSLQDFGSLDPRRETSEVSKTSEVWLGVAES